MVIKIEKNNVFSVTLFIVCVIQITLILASVFDATETRNHLMFILNYVIGFLIIADLLLKGVSTHFLTISFFSCFMLFLMGQKPFKPDYDVFLTFARLKLNVDQYLVFSCILFLGLIVTYVSYLYYHQKIKVKAELVDLSERPKGYSIKSILFILLMVTLPCAFYMQAKIVSVRSAMSYTSGYLINVDVPGVIKAAYYVYSSVVLLYLALKPSAKMVFFVLSSFMVIEGGLQLFQGRRALFGSTLLFCVWYLLKYYNIRTVGLRFIIRIAVVAIIVIMLFYIVEQVRSDSSAALSFDFIKRFLVSTGGSDSVIANTIYRKDDFPKSGIVYFFDPLLNNPIGNILQGKASVAQGMEYLQLHNSFSHWISYLTEPSLYLSGHGMGSCYLAEAYLAFGMIGVIIISVIIGHGLLVVNRMTFNGNIFRSSVIFFAVKHLFSFPRDGTFSWIGGFIYLLFTFFILYPFYIYGERNKG